MSFSGEHLDFSLDSPRSVVSGDAVSLTVTASADYTRSDTVEGTCTGGTWAGDVYTTGAITADCTVVFSATPDAPVPPTITFAGSTPADGATDVPRTVAPQMTFSTALDSTTATSTNVTLSSIAGPVPASITVAGAQLTITPSQPLALLTTYSLLAGTGLAGSNGATLAAAQSLSFKTADAAWRAAQQIETSGGDAYSPQIAFNAGGNAVAVWAQYDGTEFSIYANYYVAGTGWGTAQLIEVGNDFAYDPSVAIDAGGNAIAVWHQFSGVTLHIHSNRYVPGSGWGTVQQIEFGGSHAYTPQIAIDASGDAMAVWYQFDGGGVVQSIRANRYVAGVGWGTAELIEAGGFNAYNPQIAVDTGGNAMAVWSQFDGTTFSIYANHYVDGAGWGTAELIEAGGSEAYEPQIVIDAGGNALAVWYQHDGTVYDIHANRYTAGAGWDAAQVIDTGSEEATHPQIAFNADGNAIAVWAQSDGVVHDVVACRYVSGTGWDAPQLIESGSGEAIKPQIAIDADGNAVAIWRQFDGAVNSIYANRYLAGGTWSTPQLIETGSDGAVDPQIAIDGSGNAIVVWNQPSGGAQQIYAARFD